MTDSQSDQDERLTEAVLQYLADYPGAMDSLEGIAEFWVMRNTVRVELNRLARVLRRLVESGVLEEVGRKPHCSYRLKQVASRESPPLTQ